MNKKYYYAIFWTNFDNFRGIFISDKEYKNSSKVCELWCEQMANEVFHYSSYVALKLDTEVVEE
jgi:hypothetical protein